MKWLLSNWERVLFSLMGFVLFSFAFYYLVFNQVTEAIGIFLLGVFTFFYANVSRFKRFKGLGFEAELWDDKKKEAEHLIEKLRGVVSIYTREIVLSKVMAGRWGGGSSWHDRWKLFDDLTEQHSTLGQEIDFSDLKHEVDSVFLFDICSPLGDVIRRSISEGKNQASKKIGEKFGSPVTDLEGHNADHKKLRSIDEKIKDSLQHSRTGDLAKEIQDMCEDSRRKLIDYFGIELEIEPVVLDRLSRAAELYQQRPLEIDEQLIDWAEEKLEL